MLSGDNGILQRATDAKTQTDEAQIRERVRLAYNSALTKDISEQNGEVQQATFEDELKVEFPNKIISIEDSSDKEEWIVTIDGITENVPIGKSTPRLADLVEIGDYVTYDATSGQGAGLTVTASDIANIVQTIDTSTNEESGANVNGTFTSSDIDKWRVISVDGGFVRIVGETPTPNKVTFGGIEGFKNAETVLNKISEIYGKGNGATGAKSITLDDLNLNYDNIQKNESEYTYTSGKFFKQIKEGDTVVGYENTLTEASSTNPITIVQTTWDGTPGGPTIFNNSEKMWSIYRKLAGNDDFWFANRAVHAHTPNVNANFHLFYSFAGAAIRNGDALFHSVNGFGNTISCAVAPVVSLKSNIIGTRSETGEGDNKIVTWTLDL